LKRNVNAMAAISDAETLFTQGQQHEKSGRCADAARCYEQAVALRHPPAFAPLSMMLSG
jgi:predicted TPR repeat methyltransferase